MPRPPTNSRKRWTDADIAKLQNLVSINKSVQEIARELGRTLGAIKTQLGKLAKERQKREEKESRQKKKAKDAVQQPKSIKQESVKQQQSTKTTVWIKQEQTTATNDDDDDTHTSHARKLQPSQPRRKLSSVFSSGLRIPKKEPVAPNDDAEGHLYSLIYATGPTTPPTSSVRIVSTTPSTSSNNARPRYRSSSCGRTLKPSPAGRSLQAKKGSLADDGYSRMVQQKQFCNSLSPMHHTKLSGRFVDTHKAEGLKSTPTTLMSSDPVKPLIVVTGLKSAQRRELDLFLAKFKDKVETVSLGSRSEAPSHCSYSHDHGRRRDRDESSSNVRCRDMHHEREQDVDRKARSRAVAPPRAHDEDLDRRSRCKSVMRSSHGGDERNSSRYKRSRSVAPDRENRTVRRGDPEKLYVGWLHPRFNDQVLRRYFEDKFGAVRNVEVKYDNRGASKGFGYVTFENPSNARMVINESRHAPLYIDGVEVCVDWVKDDHRNDCSRERSHRRDSHFSQESGSRRNRKRSTENDYHVRGPSMKRRKRT